MKKLSFRNICPNKLVNGGTWIPTQVCPAPGLSTPAVINKHTYRWVAGCLNPILSNYRFSFDVCLPTDGWKTVSHISGFFFPRVCYTRGLFILTVNVKVQFGGFQNNTISTEQASQKGWMKRKRMLKPRRKAKASQEHQQQDLFGTRKH